MKGLRSDSSAALLQPVRERKEETHSEKQRSQSGPVDLYTLCDGALTLNSRGVYVSRRDHGHFDM